MKTATDFWSRRKALVEAESEAEAKQAELPEAQAPEAEQKSDAEILAELDLAEPETLGPGDDFSAYMAKAVPARIRNRALRKLWLSNPALANLDSLVDYGEDFTDSAMAVEAIQTTYQVGRGMLKHILAQEAEAEKADDDVPVEEADDPEPDLSDEDPVVLQSFASAAPYADQPDEEEPVSTETARPRRMRLSYAD